MAFNANINIMHNRNNNNNNNMIYNNNNNNNYYTEYNIKYRRDGTFTNHAQYCDFKPTIYN